MCLLLPLLVTDQSMPAVLLELQWKFQTNWESVTVPGQN
jgi:hypothetical protein